MIEVDIKTMGARELQDYKRKVISSLLNDEKIHSLIQEIEQRENNLNKDTSMVEYAEIKED